MTEIVTTNLTTAEIQEAFPTEATAQITTSLGTDTIELNPLWMARLFKRIRKGGSGTISLYGCLPEDSIEIKACNAHVATNRSGISDHTWNNWLQAKPATEEVVE
ncbi:MAG: hypothetical protein ACI8ZB_002576 [Desulforhopalus sp.]|jgi:hypothetical protein